MTKKRTRRATEPGWYWVQGLRKLSGVKVWVPLYCSRTEVEAQQTLRVVEAHATRRIEVLGDKHAEKEAAHVGAYRAFRVVAPGADDVRCTCSSNFLKRVRRDNNPLWKCLNCERVWPRTPEKSFTTEVNDPGEAPVKPSKALKARPKGDETPRRRSNRQKKPQRPVSNRRSR